MSRMSELASEQEQLDQYEQWEAAQEAAYHQSMLEVQQQLMDLIDSLEASEAITKDEAAMLRWACGVKKSESEPERSQLEMAVTAGDQF